MEAARESLAAAGCSVLVVSQAKPQVLSLYLARRGLRVPVVCDPDRTSYAAFGLERTGWLTFFRPGVLWGYIRGLFRGYGVKKPYEGEDLLQLGGDFLLDRSRRVVFAHPSATPTDRPSTADILAALSSARTMERHSPANLSRVDRPEPRP